MTHAADEVYKFTIDLVTSDDDRVSRALNVEDKKLGRLLADICGVEQAGFDARGIHYTGTEEGEVRIKKAFSYLVVEDAINKKLLKTVVARIDGKLNDRLTQKFDEHANENQATRAASGKKLRYKFEPRNPRQQEAENLIKDPDKKYILLIGAAGTGKTHLGVAVSNEMKDAPENGLKKLALGRPAVGSGKDQGAMPGGLREKVAHYMRPLYDELCKVKNTNIKNILAEAESEETLEISGIEFLQGRTFENTMVIIDEVQNTTKEQIRNIMTRNGPNTKIILCGDDKQILSKIGENSGLTYLLNAFNKSVAKGKQPKSIGMVRFLKEDIVRDPSIIEVLDMFDDYDAETGTFSAEGQNKKKPFLKKLASKFGF